MRKSQVVRIIGAIALVFVSACGKPQLTARVSVFPPECEILPVPGGKADSITVASLGALHPELAPWSRDAGGRVLPHQVYETLITIDCLGEVQAGLAESWREGEGGRQWTFELREEARFWDGLPVTADDLVWVWTRGTTEPVLRYAGIDSIRTDGDRVLHVYFTQRHRTVPRVFADRSFTVAIAYDDSPWPVGSGPYQIATPRSELRSAAGLATTARAESGEGGTVIRFLEPRGYDARDLLEGTVDVMVTDDPAVIEYAESRPRLVTVALPWDRTYVLLSTSRARAIGRGGAPGSVTAGFTERLARDAVRCDARGYQSPSWWDEPRRCVAISPPFATLSPLPRHNGDRGGTQRIMYDESDPVARDLAERIVALASADPAASSDAAEIASAVPGLNGDASIVVAVGVAREALAASLRGGDDFAYIVALPRHTADPCYEARRLLDRARWLATLGNEFPSALIPLVDARVHVIADGEKLGLAVDWYGNLIVNGVPRRDDTS